ncbi:uncharacterized protein LOC130369622 isoform X3 [Hyla sarda]|uniref:uncharacterized protein LOC130369622 isoform X3 n=1 Tax=Hyla sarda TaxID=327740 RepID=UPI0024C46DD3|nr:uncharacterized protein LOC130369622 isoform X3 [Hyla sarda]
MSRARSMQNKELGRSPDPRSMSGRPQGIIGRLQRKKAKISSFPFLGKIAEENVNPNKDGSIEENCSENELCKMEENRPCYSELSVKNQDLNDGNSASPSSKNLKGTKEKYQSLMRECEMSRESVFVTSKKINVGAEASYDKRDEELENVPHAVNETTSDHSASDTAPFYREQDEDVSEMNTDYETSFSSPELVREDDNASSSSSFDHESYDDFDFTALDSGNECSYSPPQQVCEDDSQIKSGKTVYGQEIRGNRNSTLMEIRRAQAIDDVPGPQNISNISPIEKDCDSQSDRRNLNQKQTCDPDTFLVPGFIRQVAGPKERIRASSQSGQVQKTCPLPSTTVSDDSQIKSGKTVYGQEIRGNRNSTLMEIRRAQAIDDVLGPQNISNISPIEKDCDSQSDRRNLYQKQTCDHDTFLVPGFIRQVAGPKERIRASSQSGQVQKTCPLPSTSVSGKRLYKIRNADTNGLDHTNNGPCGSEAPKIRYLAPDEPIDIPKIRALYRLHPRNKPFSSYGVQKYLMPKQHLPRPCPPKQAKRVRFTDPLTMENSSTDPNRSSSRKFFKLIKGVEVLFRSHLCTFREAMSVLAT